MPILRIYIDKSFHYSYRKYRPRVSSFYIYKFINRYQLASVNHLINAIKLNRADIVEYLMTTNVHTINPCDYVTALIALNAIYHSDSSKLIKCMYYNPYDLHRCTFSYIWRIKDIASIRYIFNLLIDHHCYDTIIRILYYFPPNGDIIYEYFYESDLLIDVIERKYVFQFDHIRKLAHMMINKETIPRFSDRYFDARIIAHKN